MYYSLKNGKQLLIRKPTPEDAKAIVDLISRADTQTTFLARNPGEFQTTVEAESKIIEAVLANPDAEWFLAEYENKIVGQCAVGLIRRNERFRHRADVAFVVDKSYCGMGIGGKMMEACIAWCRDRGILQIELDVVKQNERAIRMYQSFGFEVVGTLPRAMRYPDGTYADEYYMVLCL